MSEQYSPFNLNYTTITTDKLMWANYDFKQLKKTMEKLKGIKEKLEKPCLVCTERAYKQIIPKFEKDAKQNITGSLLNEMDIYIFKKEEEAKAKAILLENGGFKVYLYL